MDRMRYLGTDESASAVAVWADDALCWFATDTRMLRLRTAHGVVHARPGDYLLRGTDGRYHVYRARSRRTASPARQRCPTVELTAQERMALALYLEGVSGLRPSLGWPFPVRAAR